MTILLSIEKLYETTAMDWAIAISSFVLLVLIFSTWCYWLSLDEIEFIDTHSCEKCGSENRHECDYYGCKNSNEQL